MLSKLMSAFFGCWHSHYSFPITVRNGSRSIQGARTGTYVVCLDCGKEFTYNWHEMRVVETQPRAASRALVTKEAA